jgi:selenophosphate synthase
MDGFTMAQLCDPQTSGGLLLFVAPSQANDVAQTLEERGLPSRPIGRAIAATEGSPLLQLNM